MIGENSGASLEECGTGAGPASVMRALTDVSFRAWFPAGHVGFQGHFPGNPLLPGFLHIELVLDVLRLGNRAVALAQVRSAKFLHPIRPGEIIDLNVHLEPGGVVTAELCVGAVTVSAFELELLGMPPGAAQK